MIRVTLKGHIESVKDVGNFLQVCLKQKNHPSDKYNLGVSKKDAEEYRIKVGKVAEIECNLIGRFPWLNLYIIYCRTAYNYKQLDEYEVEEFDGN